MDMTPTVIVPDSPKKMKAAISQMLQQIDVIREQMRADDAEIAQIRAEKAALRVEAQALGDETRAIMANFWSVI